MALLGGIEAGGTKFVCAIGDENGRVHERHRIETSDPTSTLARVLEFFAERAPDAVGVAAFGPLETRSGHHDHGTITSTPKVGWQGTNLIAPFERLGVPVVVDTDVNGAALAEWRLGAGRGHSSIVYLTVGTGVGGGAVVSGSLIRGLGHPEMGHVTVRRQPSDSFGGVCPYHGDCLEGMASGPAIGERWGRPPRQLGSKTDAAVALEASYLASGLRQIVYVLAPELVVIGGGISKLPGLHTETEKRLTEEMAGYAVKPEHSEGFVVAPGLGDDSGIVGALMLASQAV